MADLNTVVDAYLAVWNETDATARRQKIDSLWAEDGEYVDPLASVSGRDGVDQVVAGAQEQFAGLMFVRGKTYDEHHNIVRFTWDLVPAEGAEAIAIGFDVLVVDDAGQIKGVYGFIDKLPGGA
jgi:hypothetical protein